MAAPPVEVQALRDRRWQFAWAAWCALVAALVCAWGVSWAAWPVHLGVALTAAFAVAASALAWRWPGAAVGRLAWDGQAWHWHDAHAPDAPGLELHEVRVMLDLDRWVLVRLGASPARWLALGPEAWPGNWPALRAALYSRRPEPSPFVRDAEPKA